MDDLDHCVAKKRNGDILIIGGDFNACVGVRGRSTTSAVGRYGKRGTNTSGKRLHDWLEFNEFTSTATHFQKRKY